VKRPEKFFEAIAHAHLVIAGNNYLADKARLVNKRTVVIPTTVNTDHHVPKPALRNSEKIVIGWSGSISTIKHFTTLLPVLKYITEKHSSVVISIIADKEFQHPDLPVKSIVWSPSTEVDALNSFDIGIMPLPDDEWSRGKCGLKALSYMACGVPAILSPVGVNREIIQHGINGFLAGDQQEWILALEQLIASRQLRNEMGQRGRETVVQKYSVAANRELYLQVFSEV
jgi:glycosyltransferase involved in cell wall biosynthesis